MKLFVTVSTVHKVSKLSQHESTLEFTLTPPIF